MRDDQPIMDHLNSYVGNTAKPYKLGLNSCKIPFPKIITIIEHTIYSTS